MSIELYGKQNEEEKARTLTIPGEKTATSLTLPSNLLYERWEDIGETLKHIERGVQWWIGDWLLFGARKYGELYSQALEADYSAQTFMNAKWVAGKIEPSRRREVLSFGHHAEVASLEPDQQDGLLSKAVDNNWTVRQLRSDVKWTKYVSKRPPPPEPGPVSLDTIRRYDLIYADPPWAHDFSETEERDIENPYPTMTTEAICALPVQDVALDNCVMFLWVSAPKLPEALRVMEAWGFTYRAQMVWVKDHTGIDYYVRGQHELLLIGKKGKVPQPREEDRPSSVIWAARSGHSHKPIEFYEVLETMYPDLDKLELFCMQPREGWAAWGLELQASVQS